MFYTRSYLWRKEHPDYVSPNESICSIPECNTRVLARGWCEAHYMQWRRGTRTDVQESEKEYQQDYERIVRPVLRQSPERRERLRQQARERYKRIRREVIQAYGDRCECCGEATIDFLTLDHVLDDGRDHRRETKTNMYEWARRHNFPKTLQVLCWNCNMAKAHGGCPHQTNKLH